MILRLLLATALPVALLAGAFALVQRPGAIPASLDPPDYDQSE